jgi:hypothetical protein
MKCLICQSDELVWQSDDAVYAPNDEFDYAVVSFWTCGACEAFYEVYHGRHSEEVKLGLYNDNTRR